MRQAPFATHYHIARYVEEEKPAVLGAFPELDQSREDLGSLHGGHGALTIALRNPSRFRSVSMCPNLRPLPGARRGEKAFRGYLGENRSICRATTPAGTRGSAF